MNEIVEGIVLTEKDYGETSKILNVMTKKYGIIGIISKGCRTMKSHLRSVSSKLTYGNFNIYYKEGKLSILKDVDVIDTFKNIKKDIYKISYASFLLELADQVMKHSNDLKVYDILISGLVKINEGYNEAIITNIIELKYLDFLGIMPVIDRCSICGKTTSIATISSKAGGYVCNRCLTNEKIVSDKTIKLIRMFYYVDIDKISKLDISDSSRIEINDFLDEYYDSYSGLYLKNKSFLKNIKNI